MSSPLAMIFTQNKLMSENYIDQKRNLDIVLTAENHKIVLTRLCLIKSIKETNKEDKEAYRVWIRYDQIAKYYILASMKDMLQQQYSHFETVRSMMHNLVEMFSDQTCQMKQVVIRKLMNCRIRFDIFFKSKSQRRILC